MKCQYNSLICLFAILLFGTIANSGCNKLVDVQPPATSINGSNVFESDATATAVLTSIYAKMSQPSISSLGPTSLSLFAGLSADELSLYSAATNQTQLSFYRNTLTTMPALAIDYWNIFYPIVYVTNSAIEGLNNSHFLTPSVKKQLLGEARFMRAFCYFYLVNLYGDVPLAVTSDYKINSQLGRTSTNEIWKQIIADLQEAETLLSEKYLNDDIVTQSSDRVRPTKWAAAALLARSYLYTADYMNAEKAATSIISNTGLFSLILLEDVFQKNNNEAIWQLQPVNTGWNTEDARTFNLSISPSGFSDDKPSFMNSGLLTAFEQGDQRKSKWVDNFMDGSDKFFFPAKYKSATLDDPITEYQVVFRLAEQYLIRAEARAQQNNLDDSKSDLNQIRTRAGLSNVINADKTMLMSAILHERQVELFTEWGHRWLDLKRTNNVDAVMSIITPTKANGLTWQSFQQWYPIPATEIQRDYNLRQNPGY